MLALAREAGEAPLILLLDEVEDTYNLGAALRSAEALGAHGAVIPKRRAAPLNSGALKASAGAWEHVPVDRVTNMARTIESLKEAGLWILGADPEAEQSIYDTELTGPLALVLGGEDKGLSPLIRKSCDFLVGIPMKGKINSLNISAAAAIILSEACRQRKSSK
jgi:23S rRNA (guanosine2251-2'-O)-methyltransferase